MTSPNPMHRKRPMARSAPLVLLATALALGLTAALAQAQFSRTYVSAASGSDGNSCGLGAPCRSFQRAHNQTNDQGEITVLDSGDYTNPSTSLTITKSISIVNDGGGEASILVSGGFDGVTVNGGAGAYVNLRGITIQGVGSGNGIRFNSGFSLTITNCVVRNLTGFGIFFVPSANSNLSVSSTLVADNGLDGIVVQPIGSNVTVKVVLDRVEAYSSFRGLVVAGQFGTGSVNVTAVDSVAANNADAGFTVFSATGKATTSLMVVRSVAANNGTGLAMKGSPLTVRLGQSSVTGNTTSWQVTNGAVLQSYGDNDIDGNGDGNPAPPTISKK